MCAYTGACMYWLLYEHVCNAPHTYHQNSLKYTCLANGRGMQHPPALPAPLRPAYHCSWGNGCILSVSTHMPSPPAQECIYSACVFMLCMALHVRPHATVCACTSLPSTRQCPIPRLAVHLLLCHRGTMSDSSTLRKYPKPCGFQRWCC
jgi:hypothetical protein